MTAIEQPGNHIQRFRERALLAERDGRHDAAALLREAATDLEMTAQPAGTTHYVSCCPECHAAKTFTTARARELWEAFHTHDGENSTDE